MHVDTAVIVGAIAAVTGAIGFIARLGIRGENGGWVFGRELKAMKDDRDFWRREARANRKVASTAVETGEQLASDLPDVA